MNISEICQSCIKEQIRRDKKAEAEGDATLIFLVIWGTAVTIAFLVVGIIRLIDFIKSWRIGQLTTTPIIPFPVDDLEKFGNSEGMHFLCGFADSRHNDDSIELIKKFKKLVGVEEDTYIPYDVRVISMKMDGFVYGTECHEFRPIGGEAPGSYYTYQMFGDNRIQVTNYVKNGISYVAGYCIYIPERNVTTSIISYRKEVIDTLKSSPKYDYTKPVSVKSSAFVGRFTSSEVKTLIKKDPTSELTEKIPTDEWSVKSCSELKRDVITASLEGSIYHKEWDKNSKKMNSWRCSRCSAALEWDLPPVYSSLSMA